MSEAISPAQEIVQLVHLPQWCVDQPPLGIAYLTGNLEAKGIPTKQVDYSAELFAELPADKKHFLDSDFCQNWLHLNLYESNVQPTILPWLERWANELANSPAPILGFTMLTTSRLCTVDVVRRVKQLAPEKFIVIGGPHVTRYEGGPEIIREKFVDAVVPGEGEEVMFEIVESLLAGKSIEHIPGLLLRKNGEIVDTGERQLIKAISDDFYRRYFTHSLREDFD